LDSGRKVCCFNGCPLINLIHRLYPDDVNLTIGQLAWLDYDLLLPAMRPLLLSHGKPETEVKTLVENAHHDLYYPIVNPSTRLHVVHAIKRS